MYVHTYVVHKQLPVYVRIHTLFVYNLQSFDMRTYVHATFEASTNDS